MLISVNSTRQNFELVAITRWFNPEKYFEGRQNSLTMIAGELSKRKIIKYYFSYVEFIATRKVVVSGETKKLFSVPCHGANRKI